MVVCHFSKLNLIFFLIFRNPLAIQTVITVVGQDHQREKE